MKLQQLWLNAKDLLASATIRQVTRYQIQHTVHGFRLARVRNVTQHHAAEKSPAKTAAQTQPAQTLQQTTATSVTAHVLK
jgi:hypothetical protein